MLEKILKKIIEETDISKEELIEKIKQKQKELQIISFEGAAYLVAKDLGLDLVEYKPRKLEMKNIVSGMKNVNVVGKIFKISQIVEFERNGKKGKVVNLFVSDGTDYVKIPLWNEQVSLVEDKKLQVGDTVQIISGIARENTFGEKEISLRGIARIALAEEPLEMSVDELKEKFLFSKPKRLEIVDIKTQGNYQVLAKIVYLFKGKYVFGFCPTCNSRVNEINDEAICENHGKVSPTYCLVIPCMIDDGTGCMRAVFFRKIAERVCNIPASELKEIEPDKRYELLAQKLLGRELLFTGRVRKNKIFDILEMVVNDFNEVSYSQEISGLVKELESLQ